MCRYPGEEVYREFLLAMADMFEHVLVIAGNHDARDPMRTAFADVLPNAGPLNWARLIGDIHLIGLDTLVEGQGGGMLAPESLLFLQDALSKVENAPVLLALHHPPFSCGIGFMDEIGLTNRHALRDVLAGYAGPLRIVCGHIHNLIVSDVAGHIAISAPSPASTIAFDRRPIAPVGFMTQEDGCLLHRWDAGFQSIRIGPIAGSGPFPF